LVAASWCGVRLLGHLPAVAAPERPRTAETARRVEVAADALASAVAPQGDALVVFVAGLVKSDRPTAFKALDRSVTAAG
jgi:hypothetical protein